MSFDLDNTLVDRDAAARAWWRAQLPDASADELEEVLERDASGRSPRMELFGWACARFPALGAERALWARFRAELPACVVPSEGVLALVDRVAARYPVAILTNGGSAFQREKIARAGLAGRVERVLVSDELGVAKPHADAFAAVVAALGVPAASVLHVGDDPGLDVIGAVDAGLAACWVGVAWRHSRALPANVLVIARVTELPSVLPC